jgi:hypothetical protein
MTFVMKIKLAKSFTSFLSAHKRQVLVYLVLTIGVYFLLVPSLFRWHQNQMLTQLTYELDTLEQSVSGHSFLLDIP